LPFIEMLAVRAPAIFMVGVDSEEHPVRAASIRAQRTKLVPNLFIIVFFEHCLDVPSFTPRFGRQSRAFAVACTTNRLAPLSALQAPTQSQWWREVVSR